MNKLSCGDINKLKLLSARYKVNYILRPNLHITINGPIVINYYPHSKNKTAYVKGTGNGVKGCTFEDAFLMSVTIPKLEGCATKRKGNYRKPKKEMLRRKPYCNWCGDLLTTKTATLDHIIPISLGGLNNRNNYTLACEVCNTKRGNKMPEVLTHG